MNAFENYFISYPAIKHPLADEKPELKLKYVSLLEFYRLKICPTSRLVLARFERFKKDFLSGENFVDQGIDKSIKEIMKTRFTPFRFFSYRYVFLFDCIYLLTVDGFTHVQKIGNLMKSSVNQRYHKKLDFVMEKMVSNPSELSGIQMITPEMIQTLEAVQAFLATEEKSVVFTATMSAGKSTLINALIGQPLAQTKKAACTAAVMEFSSCPVYHPRYNVFVGDEEKRDLLPEEVRKTSEGGTKPMIVTGYFNSRTSHRKLRVIDTPGVDSSRNPTHRDVTRGELKRRDHDLLVYVIPVGNYGNEDDLNHLQYIKDNARYKRIVFVLNMMDTCDFEDDSVEEILRDIKEHLENNGFQEPIICPLSAKVGLLFKKTLSKAELTANEREELDSFCRSYQDLNYDMSRYYHVAGEDRFPDIGHPIEKLPYDHIYQLYLRTGLPQFESVIMKLTEEV